MAPRYLQHRERMTSNAAEVYVESVEWKFTLPRHIASAPAFGLAADLHDTTIFRDGGSNGRADGFARDLPFVDALKVHIGRFFLEKSSVKMSFVGNAESRRSIAGAFAHSLGA